MKIPFDTEGITSSCPVADAGIATFEECKDCDYFGGSSHFEVECSYKEAQQEETWTKVKFDTEKYDGEYNPEGHIFKAPQDGLYSYEEPEQEE